MPPHNYEERLQQLEAIVKRQGEMLEVIFGDSETVELGPFEKWRQTKAADEYAGKHVAFLPSEDRVIFASGSLAEVISKLPSIDRGDKTVVGYVR